MKLVKQNHWLHFVSNKSGQVSILFAILAVPMIIMLGGAVDWALKFNQEKQQRHALDTALLAAVSANIDEALFSSPAAKNAQRQIIFNSVFALNYEKQLPAFTFSFTDKNMKVSLTDQVETNFLKLANIDNMHINIAAKALYPKESTFEIVLIFDATGSMSGIISNVKSNAINFTGDILTQLNTKGVHLNNIDTKVISYKDYWVDSKPMKKSRFFHLPAENSKFSNFINPIQASGGGDLPESGLEAIKYAIDAKSPSRVPGVVANKLIVLWTDAEAIPFKRERKSAVKAGLITTGSRWSPWYRRNTHKYPRKMPTRLNKFKELWDDNKDTSILLFYGKNGQGENFYPWKQMKDWDRTKHLIGNPNNIDYADLIEEIATTMSDMTKTRLSE